MTALLRSVALLALMVCCAAQASASVMVGATGVTTTIGNWGSPPWNLPTTINQAGLITGYTSGVTDAATYNSTHTAAFDEWLGNATTGFVTFDLGSVQQLDGFRFWNSSWSSTGGWMGVNQFTLYADNDSNPLNGLGANLGNFTTSNTVSQNMQSFSITGATRYVTMQIHNSKGGIGVGFAEVAFTAPSESVPEPATLTMFGLGALGLGLAGYRRRNRAR